MAKKIDPNLATALQLLSQGQKPAKIRELLLAGERRELSNAMADAYARWLRAGYQVLHPGHENWPAAFDTCPAPPVLIWAIGNVKLLNVLGIAIIGTRNPSRFGESAIAAIVDSLADKRPIIVSGLARGCDTLAHQAALKHQLAQVAILGSGLGQIYPPENRSLVTKILETGGVIISEVQPQAKVAPGQLMARNRLQVALARAVIVAQTAGSGGTIGTVNYCLRANRPLFVPMPPNQTNANFGIYHLANTPADDLVEQIPGLRSAKPQGNTPVAYGITRGDLKHLPDLLGLSTNWQATH